MITDQTLDASAVKDDSTKDAHRPVPAILGGYYDQERMSAYLDSCAEMVRYLEANTHVRFYPIALSDYYPAAPGARIGRTLLTKDYDGRVLGPMLGKLRNPMPGTAAFDTMQTDPQYLGLFKNAFRTWPGFSFSAGRFANFVMDWLRFGKGAHLANGNALAGRLLHSAMDAGVTLRSTRILVPTGQNRGV